MKKSIFSLVMLWFCLPMIVWADSYTMLWKQYEDAMKKDLPQTQLTYLNKIAKQAKQQKDYGHLLKAQLLSVAAQTKIAPDSLEAMMARLEADAEKVEKTNKVLAAVYQTVLGKYYQRGAIDSIQRNKANYFLQKAMAHPEMLAEHKANEYKPLVVEGVDSKIFYDDLLHVIGLEVGNFQKLHDYYIRSNNRVAACYTALQLLRMRKCAGDGEVCKSKYIQQLDSLIQQYQDLRIAGEVAIERYSFMETARDIKVEDKVEYINYALNKWGEWKRMNILRNAYKYLTLPQFSVDVEHTNIIPKQNTKIIVNNIRNVSMLTLNVWKTAYTGEVNEKIESNKVFEDIKKKSTLIESATQVKKFVGVPEFQQLKDSFDLKALPLGVYLLEVTSNNKDVPTFRQWLFVSNLKAVYTLLPHSQYRIAVLNATTGQPVADAKVKLTLDSYNSKPEQVLHLTCNKQGEVLFTDKNRNPNYIYVYTDDDKNAAREYFHVSGYFTESDNKNVHLSLFTDRSIYRPGQTVNLAGIVYEQDNGDKFKPVVNKRIPLVLKDANYQEVVKKEVTTDEYGKFSTEFSLPAQGLVGYYHIATEEYPWGNVYFRVEEYKRPTFTVDFPKVNQKYGVGDTVVVKAMAKTYAGVPVQGAKVSYKVVRKKSIWWYWRSNEAHTTIVKTGEGMTDVDGHFMVEIPLEMKMAKKGEMDRYYNFVVEAEVTDQSGETRQGTMSLPLGTKPTAFNIDMPSIVEKKDKATIQFVYRNMAGANIDTEVKYYIDGLEHAVVAKTNEKVVLNLDKVKSGKHRITAICEKDTAYADFVLFSLKDTKTPYDTPAWFYISGQEFTQDNASVYVQLGGNYAPQYILYNVVSGERVLENGVIHLNNEVQTREFKYKSEYGDGITLTYAWVKDGKAYTYSKSIVKALPDKKLTLKWHTFRNKLVPGQKEEWRLQVLQPNGKPAMAQMMTVMYDKSLDVFTKHDWNFNTSIDRTLPYMQWLYTARAVPTTSSQVMRYRPLTFPDLDFSRIDNGMFVYHVNDYYDMQDKYVETTQVLAAVAKQKVMIAGSAPRLAKQSATRVAAESVEYAAENMATEQQADVPAMSAATTTHSIRENLNETAFFYPALSTDKDGNVEIKFTLPESITTWHFMGLAHDKNINYGLLTEDVIAKKSVMVQPNMPRFMRLGDTGVIAAKIFNTTEEAISGRAILELLNPETNNIVYRSVQDYQLVANGSSVASFDIDLKEGTELYANGANVLVARVVVEGKGYSDGEQHYLPILSDMEWVTNTLAFTQHGAGVQTVDLSKLFASQSTNKRLTIEYTNNPAWLMVQSLPYVDDIRKEDAIGLAVAYYANSIARYILKKVPYVKQTMEQWKRETAKETSLMSNLQKNEELKELVLTETPWVAEGVNEEEKKQALIRYFDENNLNNRLRNCLEQLSKLQQADGSWSWWPGMRGSLYVTTKVAEMLARLQMMVGASPEIARLQNNALRFMNEHVKSEVKNMKKHEAKGHKKQRPSELAISYLYITSLMEQASLKDVASERDYLVERLSTQTSNLTIYGKAISAVVLAKNNRRDKAKEYLQSMKEYSVYTPEMGRYYDTRNAYYSWFDYRIPTQVAALEAFQILSAADKNTIEEMQRWLLMSKRTQQWDTPINSVEAIYAFLNGRMSTLDTSAEEQVKLSLDEKPLDLSKPTAGLGYVKVAVEKDEMKTFTAQKSSSHTSWGAVYAQSMQKTQNVKTAAMGLKVKREILGKGDLKVGSKVVVRITIEADRDYDYVQVVDKRAACMEPVNQVSGYRYGCYITPRDHTTNYYFDVMPKGKRVIETEYYIDRQGTFSTGTCVVQCAYSPEYAGRAEALTLQVK